MSGAVSALVVLGVLVLVGLPVASSIHRAQPDWTALAFESAVIGLIVELLVAIVLLHAGYYSLPTALVLTLAVVGATTYAMRRGDAPRAEPPFPRGIGAALIGLATLALIVVALQIRHAPSYFIFQTGDMGGYVNSANILTKSGMPFGTEPQGFTLFLRETNLLLGKANTVAGLPTLGAILLLGVVAFARVLRLHVAVALALGFLVVVHPVMVWFSLFPVSESLYAVLLIALLYLLVQARANTSHAYAVIGGIVAGSLLLVRGEAMLLAPIAVVVLLTSAAVDDDATVAVQRRFTIVALATLFASYAYDVHYTHLYFRAQLRHLLPGFLFPFAEHAQLIQISVFLVIGGALALALVLWGTRMVSRHARPRVVSRPLVFWRYAYIAVIALSLLGLALFRRSGLVDTLLRWGPVLLALCVIGIVVVAQRPGKYVDAACGLMFLLVIGAYSVLFARRVPEPKIQTYYLYFDRYLFSEVLPAALPLAAIGLQAIVDACARFSPNTRVLRLAITAVIAIVVIALVPQTRDTRRETRFRLFGKSYQALHAVDRLTRTDGASAVVYSGSRRKPTNWFYPNTYRAFALPLKQSFDREVFGLPPRGLGRDVIYDPARARQVLQHNQLESGYLVQLRLRGERRHPDDDHMKFLGTVRYACPVIGQTTHGPAAPWKIAVVELDVYRIS